MLRLDYLPNRLFRYDGRRWNVVEDNLRAQLTGANNNTLLGSFVNNSAKTRLNDGTLIDQKVALSKVLSIKADM